MQTEAHIGVCLDRPLRHIAPGSRPDVRQVLDQLQVGIAQAVRCLGGAKGCRSNLAKAEGLKLPSPGDLHHNTTVACLPGQRTYIFDPVIHGVTTKNLVSRVLGSPQTNFLRDQVLRPGRRKNVG